MPAVEALCHLFRISPSKLTKHENILLEAELLTRLCEKLHENFRQQYRDYFRLMKFSSEMEDTMINTDFVRLIIKDILATGEYTLQGIACYANLPQEVIEEILINNHINFSLTMFRRIIELHRSVRKDLYEILIKKINTDLAA